MKKILTILCATAGLLVSTSVFSQVSNDNEDGVNKVASTAQQYVKGQVLVKFSDDQSVRVRKSGKRYAAANFDALTEVLQKYGVEEMEQLLPNEKPNRPLRKAQALNGDIIQEKDLSQLYCLTLSGKHSRETMQLVNELNELDEVEFAEPNYKVYAFGESVIATDYTGNPYASDQQYLDEYGVKKLWNKPIINPARPVIAIIDTGVDITHPDLMDNIWTNQKEADGEDGFDNDNNGFVGDVHGWDFVNNTGKMRDNNMHGTHVAGLAAASNNGIGIIGANPQAFIMPITVLQSDGSGDMATIIKGIDYAVANGATVLNLSLGSYFNSHALRQALENAYQSAVIVAAAGNDGYPITKSCGLPPQPCFPAAYSFVLGVMATDTYGYLAGFSNFDCDGPNYSSVSSMNDPDGFNYELKAPGYKLLSTVPGGKYAKLCGTSMAAPLVAGSISALQMVKQYDTQELLWGDLTHSDNILEAYNLTAQPDLELMKVQVKERKELADETEEDYGGDGEIDAGETVNIYPVLRTTWAAANNIQMHLEMGNNEDPDVVQILSGTVDFGKNLSSYGKAVSLNPLQIKVPSGIADGRHIRFKLVATCDNLDKAYEKEFVLIATNMVKISGIVSSDRTLTADHIYYVNGNLAIPEGVTLTIEPGTHLEFAEGVGLSSNGKLIANGTPDKPIVFTGHKGALWAGIWSHYSTGVHKTDPASIFTNEDYTLFTLRPTEQTPIEFHSSTIFRREYYNKYGDAKEFYLSDYLGGREFDMTAHQDKLYDVNFLTPSFLKMRDDMNAYADQFPTSPTEQETVSSSAYCLTWLSWSIFDNPRDTISYCKISNCELADKQAIFPYMKDCVFTEGYSYSSTNLWDQIDGIRVNLSNITPWYIRSLYGDEFAFLSYSNIVNNEFSPGGDNANVYSFQGIIKYSNLPNNNYFNNSYTYPTGKYKGKSYSLGFSTSQPEIDKSNNPSYLGTSREDIIRPSIFEIDNAADTYGWIDLSNMPSRPYSEAHGIVWKVVVNGKDAQDEFEDLAPLGVGKHKFEVYFNRPMNKAVAPQISFGVRDPWTQNIVDEDGGWNADGTIYTAYKTITGRTLSDGTNRIYVQGAEDNEFFEIPYEKNRFNIQINAAGSMATGFVADAGMGRVNLTWNNDENDFEDAMGFNIYRYTESERLMPVYDEWGNPVYEMDEELNYVYDENGCLIPKMELRTVVDTLRLNTDIVDIETTEYTDYDVTPGETYYYMYKVLSTDLQEYDVSNVVAATPLTSTLGDANGSGEVDVADVITTVNYAAGMDPKPFIFEAADMNVDQNIDILDVVGIIQKILNPSAGAKMRVESVATYTVEDGIVYVESPVDLAGVQLQLNAPEQETPEVLNTLNGFEHASAWLTDEDYLFLGYNMNGKTIPAGKHALFNIGNAQLRSIRLSDTMGGNVTAEAGNATAIEMLTPTLTKSTHGIYNLNGQKVAGSASDLEKLPKGVYIVDGIKVVK